LALSSDEASAIVPFEAIQDNCPWNGCKFAANTVLLLLTRADAQSKRNAVQPISRSLGGCSIPGPEELSNTRWPYELIEIFDKAKLAAQTKGSCTALHISVTDVEIMRNPGSFFSSRPGTFAHSCVAIVSPAGVYLHQAYGPRGYTLLQNIQDHDAKYPMSLEKFESSWIPRFLEFAAELGGVWTEQVNSAYNFCFHVNLVDFGSMQIGSQLDAYARVYPFEFNAQQVRENFRLLPQRGRGRKIPCSDGAMARASKAPRGYTPNGGIPHHYIPTIMRCGLCGANTGANKRCTACKIVSYCSKECQVKDWKLRHKKSCKSLRTAKGT
jgi:hypothetical protein